MLEEVTKVPRYTTSPVRKYGKIYKELEAAPPGIYRIGPKVIREYDSTTHNLRTRLESMSFKCFVRDDSVYVVIPEQED